jgi:peptidoglycan DL-endopeptidase LytE
MIINLKIIFKIHFIILFFLFGFNVFGQQKTTKHKIRKGETLTSIAKENNVSLNEIYNLNPNSKKVLKLNSILLIPISKEKLVEEKSKKKLIDSLEKTHEVLPKETLYGISKKYKISINDLKKWNPILENADLEIGQIIYVSEVKLTKNDNKEISKQDDKLNFETFIHEVLAKETKYSLAKKYKTTIQNLEELNPDIKNGLPIGYKLKINKSDVEISKSKIQPIIQTKSDSTLILSKSDTEEIKNIETETKIVNLPDSINIAKPITNLELADSLEQRGSENIGTKYHSGGTQPGGFDCSGLMIYIFQNSGIKLPRTSAEQSKFGIKIDKIQAQKGDLIFFSTNGRGNVNHVGMVVENLDGQIKFIHSSIHGGVIISSTGETYYQKAFKHINRVLE